jgi:hypothetical protein
MRGVMDISSQQAFILSLLIINIFGVIVSVMGTISGVMNAAGWSSVAVYFLLTLGHGYFQVVKLVLPK